MKQLIWLIGQQTGFEIGEQITINMSMVKGYPRSVAPISIEKIDAGTMQLTLFGSDENPAGIMSADLSYPGAEGGSWIRNDIPISLISIPRR